MHAINNSRRVWLKTCAGIGAAALAPWGPGRAATNTQLHRPIPSSGERIPVMGLGTARTFDTGAGGDELAPLREVMSLFIEYGGSMVDTSPMYGQAERVVGELVSSTGVADEVFYATKVWTRGKTAGMAQMEDSFRLMRTDHIQLMQVHNLTDTATQIGSIRGLMDAGRVKYLGITHYTAGAFDDLETWIKKEKIDYVQFPYSIANRAAEGRLLPVAADHGVATIAHRNFERGRLFRAVRGRPLPDWAAEFDCQSWGNFFLKYLIADPRMTNLVPATTKTKHLIDNMRAGIGRLPDPELRGKMVALVEAL